MKFLWIAFFAVMFGLSGRVVAATAAAADAAWADIVQSLKGAHTAPESAQLANQLKAFYEKYPDHPKAQMAWIKEQDLRQGAGPKPARVPAAAPAPVDSSVKGMVEQAKARVTKARQEGGAIAGWGEMERQGRKIIEQYPKEPAGWILLLGVAQGFGGEKARVLYSEIVSKAPTADLKSAATAGLQAVNRPRPVTVNSAIELKAPEQGKIIPLKFTATDGRPVDLAQLQGKVVLIDFWATWCGPCLAEIPKVKSVYTALHDQGFEIIGVSFDKSVATLKKFIEVNEMSWPQFCDGGGWENAINKDFGINAIPAMYLVDKKGVLRDTNSRDNLAAKVQMLLKE